MDNKFKPITLKAKKKNNEKNALSHDYHPGQFDSLREHRMNSVKIKKAELLKHRNNDKRDSWKLPSINTNSSQALECNSNV